MDKLAELGCDEFQNEEDSRICRIENMERIYDELRTRRGADWEEKLRILVEYYEGGQWLQDYEADEQGLIPKDLKRGVLSEDGLYNLLSIIK